MKTTIKKIFLANPLSDRIYVAIRTAYKFHWVARGAGRYFLNFDDFKKAFNTSPGTTNALVDLRTADGLIITIGQCYSDAMTVAEVLLRDPYIHDLNLPANPTIIDVGAFVGDFALYAVKSLTARRVIACEPSPRNYSLLLKNIAINGYADRIRPVNKAVTDGADVMMDINVPDQSMVSAYFPTTTPWTLVPGISLGQLIKEHKLESVDLLKIDCEGGEYALIESTPSDVYSRIRNVVFEPHEIEGGQEKFEKAKQRLRREGYTLREGGGLVSATRP